MLSDGRESSRLILTDRKPFRYRRLPGNIQHTAVEGDTYHHLAARFYAGIATPGVTSASQLWWVIADFQPSPVHDPTIAIAPGTVIVIPSMDTLLSTILNRAERGRVDR